MPVKSQLPSRPLSYATSISPTLVSKNRSSGVSTLCEKDIFHIDSTSKFSNPNKDTDDSTESSVNYDDYDSDGHKPDRHSHKLISSCSPSPFLSGFFKKLSNIIVLISDYRIKRRLRIIGSRVERWKSFYHPISFKELERIYEFLRGLNRSGPKTAFTALTLRLSVLEFLLDSANPPVLFSEHRKRFLTKLWADLVRDESESFGPSISEIIPDGDLFVKTLCEELAYGSGAYAVQRALKQIARTDWGHKELLRLSTPRDQKLKPGNLIIDCVMRLLRFQNGFSCTMAFQIFGRLSMSNPEVYTLLGGSMGVGWLVENLRQLSVRTEDRVRMIEMYCRALAVACAQGFVESSLENGIVSVLLRLIQRFNDRDEMMRGKIEDDLEDDLDVERDQIACCGLIIILMKDPSGKKEFLNIPEEGGEPEQEDVLTTFMNNSNRAFSDWKLLANIASIRKLRNSNHQVGTSIKEPLAWNYL
ncbi:hypothetical protein Clacol_003552 [Clathrus columnatus]|uniref:Uncharacterized protein n=1 Tax=Clathrus columnatus TaxID=1419009 RepID=A0AAV5A4W7_9AGAM|nr:hypothetical protein Clacol_003552 [Clathrus columnatus]